MSEEQPLPVGQILAHLASSLNSIVDRLEATIAIIRPPSTDTLPTVTVTLSGVVQATEDAALAVLDEAEALQEDQQRLDRAIERLRGRLAPGDPEIHAILDETAYCSKALSDRSMRFVTAMEFQDLAAQHVARVLEAVEEVRESLVRALTLFGIGADAAGARAARRHSRIGEPTRARGAGQHVADQVVAEASEGTR